MPTFSNIDGEESATVTFTVGAVSLTRNSSAELQEILVLGDPEVASSLGLARVTASAPASTNAGLNVRILSGPSSVADFSVRSVLPSTATDNPVSAAQASTVWAVQVDGRVRAQNSTIGDLLASVQQNSTVWAAQIDGRVRAQNSTIGDLLASVQQNSTTWAVQLSQYSTQVNVSSVGGSVTVRPSDTSFASSAGFHFDSSGALQINGASGSTTVNVSSLGGTVAVAQTTPSNSSVYFAVRLTNSTAFVDPSAEYVHGSTLTASSVSGVVQLLRASSTRPPALSTSDMFAARWGTLQGAGYSALVTDSGASVSDSTNTALRVNVVAGSVAGDTTVTVMPGSSASTRWFPVQIGDGSTWISDSSNRAIRVNVVAGSAAGDTTVTVMPGSSGATAFYSVRLSDGSTYVSDSTERAIRVNVTTGSIAVTGYSTTVNVSSLGGAVIVRSSAADALGTIYQSTFADLRATVHNSTIGDLLASVQQNSTVWQTQSKIQDSSGVGPNIVGTRPTTGAQGFAVRTILNDLQSTCFSTIGNNSTSATVVSSAASVRHKVYAFSITSTVQAVNSLSFRSSQASTLWQMQHQSVSSGISGITQSVTPPAWLFATAVADPLVFAVTGTTGTYHLSFSYFTEA